MPTRKTMLAKHKAAKKEKDRLCKDLADECTYDDWIDSESLQPITVEKHRAYVSGRRVTGPGIVLKSRCWPTRGAALLDRWFRADKKVQQAKKKLSAAEADLVKAAAELGA